MILPTKHLRSESSLIYIGGIIRSKVAQSSLTVDQLWYQVRREYDTVIQDCQLTYDWFILALSFSYLINVVEMIDGRIVGVYND